MSPTELQEKRDRLKKMQSILDGVASLLQSWSKIDDLIRDTQQCMLDDEIVSEESSMQAAMDGVEEDMWEQVEKAQLKLSAFEEFFGAAD